MTIKMTLLGMMVLGLLATQGRGINDASIWWHAAIPLLGTFLVGTRLGAALMAIIAVECVTLYQMALNGFPFSVGGPTVDRFTVMAAVSVMFFIAVLAWLYEASRLRALVLVRDTLQELQRANAVVLHARDQAHARGSVQGRFLDVMRQSATAQASAPHGPARSVCRMSLLPCAIYDRAPCQARVATIDRA